MANYSDLTRKEQVLARLKAAKGGWVDGPELASEECGGSEGLRRLRELVDDDGYEVRKRKHPDATRDIWQYRLVPPPLDIEVDDDEDIFDGPVTAAGFLAQGIEKALAEMDGPADPTQAAGAPSGPSPAPRSVEPAEPPVYRQPEPPRPQTRMSTAVKRKEDGTFEYVPPQRPIQPDQLTALPEPEPEAVGDAFTSMPKHISFGDVAVCPRCRQKTSRGRPKKKELTPDQEKRKAIMDRRRKMNEEVVSLVDPDGYALFRDPYSRKPIPCSRCNGYGIVPNIGPIALAPVSPPPPPAPLDLEDEAETTEAFPE